MTKQHLIIGGTGFCGPHLARQLLAGGAAVTVTSRHGAEGLSPWHQDMLAGARVAPLDMTDAFGLADQMSGQDVVIHAASGSKSRNSDIAMERDIDTNLKGTLNVMRAAALCGVKRVVYLSSAGTVYGQGRDAPYCEKDACVPISSYGIVKLASENYVSLLGEMHGISTLILRISNPVGPGQTGADGQGIVAVFHKLLRQNQPVRIFGDGMAERDYIQVDEAMKAANELINTGAEGIYNIGSGRSHRILDIVASLEALTSRTLEKQFITTDRPADIGHVRLDIKKLTDRIGWAPNTDLDAAIEKYFDWAER